MDEITRQLIQAISNLTLKTSRFMQEWCGDKGVKDAHFKFHRKYQIAEQIGDELAGAIKETNEILNKLIENQKVNS